MSLVNENPATNEPQPDAALTTPEAPILPPVHDPYAALRFGDFRLLFMGTFIATMGERMMEIALGWELYERTHSALVLGGVGLVLVIPVLLFSLPAGHIADRFNRKQIILLTQLVWTLSALALTGLSSIHGSISLIYGCLLLMGSAVAFMGPASSTMTAMLVPDSAYENAATWSSSSWQLASMIGPGLGGMLIALFGSATPVYLLNVGAGLFFVVCVLLMRAKYQTNPQVDVEQKKTWHSILEGLRFLRGSQVLMAAITLDLFAVLLGGATTLLPIFAKDVLMVGPVGLGWLRAAPSIGAVCVALTLAHRPPFKHAGRTLLLAVAGFGLATIVFGLSHSFWLSLAMLFLLGGLDNISVVIRSTLLLTRTPDEMRGRVSSVNALFIGASNELGGFESGLVAQFLGPVFSATAGGLGTILVVILVSLLWPQMRRLGTLRATE